MAVPGRFEVGATGLWMTPTNYLRASVDGSLQKAMDNTASAMTKVLQFRLSKPFPPPSKPGRYPHMRRPRKGLRSSTTVKREGRSLYVHVRQYGIWLETGTERMAARPFIRRTIHDQRRKWLRHLSGQVRWPGPGRMPFHHQRLSVWEFIKRSYVQRYTFPKPVTTPNPLARGPIVRGRHGPPP